MSFKYVRVCDVCGMVLGDHQNQRNEDSKDYCMRCWQYQHPANLDLFKPTPEHIESAKLIL